MRSAGRRRTLLIVVPVLVVALALGGWLWLRGSSLVAVQRVSVSGARGPDASQVRRALVASARTMTTLDVGVDRLRMAVAPYPDVKDLRVSAQFPHGMRIGVIEQTSVGLITAGGRAITVAGDGTLLHDAGSAAALPTIPLPVAPGGSRLTDPDALRAVALLAAAPYQLLAHVSRVVTVPEQGLVAQLRNGPSIYFGDDAMLGAKWTAASAVLADQGSVGAGYIDVTDPHRPAAGVDSAAGQEGG